MATENLRQQCGSFQFVVGEQEALAEAIKSEFTDHPNLSGIKILELRKELIPLAILRLIEDLNCRLVSASAIKADKVPSHPHTNDGEVYWGGKGGIIKLFGVDREETMEMPMKPKRYSFVLPGQMHGVSRNEDQPPFFGAKFVPHPTY